MNVGILHAKDPTYKWKLATLAPDGVGWSSLIKEIFIPTIDRVTNGDVALDWFWGGIMGDDEDYIAKMRIDQLQGMGFSGAGFVMACPEGAVMELPFLFNNAEEVDYVKGKIRKQLEYYSEKNGFMLLFLVDQDFDQLYSVNSELRTPEDFMKSKFLTWYGPLENKVLKALGASPIPVNVPEVASSVRSGVCNAFIAPAIWTVGSQLYTVVKYVSPLRIRYSPAGAVVTVKAWNTLPSEYQMAVYKLRGDLEVVFNEEVRKSNKKCYNAMIGYGLKEVKMSQDEIKILRDKCIPVWDEFAGKTFPEKLLNDVLLYLNEFRQAVTKR